MEAITLGAGLAAAGFWLFIAAVVVATFWDSARKRESEHETLRRMIEAGKEIDQALMNKLLGTKPRPDRDLRVGGLITASVAFGIAVLALVLGMIESEALLPLLGVAGLVLCISMGILAASKFLENRIRKDLKSPME